MIPLNLKGLASRNQLLWISILFTISLSANADETKGAVYHFQMAKQAYEANKCKIAIDHFKQYLAIVEEIEQIKKTSIESAVAWCQDYENTFKVSTVFVGYNSETGVTISNAEEQARKRQELLVIKPAAIP